jgi:hypothetical protein
MLKSGALRMAEPLSSREGKVTLLAVMMMLYVMALFLSISVHELMGHALAAALLGGDVYAVYLSPGSGFVSFWLPPTLSSAEVAFIYMAGILVQLIIGAAVLFLALPRIRNFILGLFTLMFCIGMTVHSSIYLFMGIIYDSGDTRYAAGILGMQPDAFMVAGMILAGVFVLVISMAALRFIVRFTDLDSERARTLALVIFWFPPLLLSGIISFGFSLFLPRSEMAYPLLNSGILLLLLGVALFLVPTFVEPAMESEHRISVGSIVSVATCFMLVMAGWAGVFGLSQESAHGVLLHDPPVQTENYYSDYTIGNAEIHMYSNGTMRIDVILRNMQESPSPLDERIYHTFDRRPDWDRYIARSRNAVVTMFDLPRGVGENLTFSTGFGTARANGTQDEAGRKCTAYIAAAGTRQFHISPGEQNPQPGMGVVTGDYMMNFVDPWKSQSGYLDEVRISWDSGLEILEMLAWNDANLSIAYASGGVADHYAAWENTGAAASPSQYRAVFNLA